MHVVYFGSGTFGLPTLQMLADEHQLLAVVSQPDRPAGRGWALTPTPISQWVIESGRGSLLLRPERVNEPSQIEQLRSLGADAWVVIAYGQKLGARLLADQFAINLHASLLPRWRGAAPINAAMLAGDQTTGNSVITLADRMDAGLVLGQTRREIDPSRTAGELHDLLSQDGPALVRQVLSAHLAATLHAQPQDEALVTLAPKLSRSDAWLDLSAPAAAVQRRVHGLTPWPGVTVRLGGAEFKLLRVQVEPGLSEQAGAAPGSLLDADRGVIACGGGTRLRVEELQPSGKRAMSWSQFARGNHPEAGSTLRCVQERA
ncbi:MAG: methionyl-tRNA formyltransferase [Leptolyngbya sp. PLA3]|nr:MAG: methionyl-tRNA formyltransferase [Cyanobacteria bacterium CYA]MCE7969800.1 methionyl-tRNA formyltransferase [Leptolyngbya sp. PL-A3]